MEQEICSNKPKWADKLGVLTSGDYDWLKDRNRRQKKDRELTNKVKTIFAMGKGTYGAEHICGILRQDCQSVSYPFIRRIMEQEDLK